MARVEHKDVADVWTPEWTWTIGGTPTDPTTVTITVLKPDGTTTVYSVPNPASPPAGVTHPSTGKLRLAEPLTQIGHWHAYASSTGAAVAAEHHEVIVDPNPITGLGLNTRALVTLDETKDWLNEEDTDTKEDLELVRLINDVSDRFHQEARREFKVRGTNPQTRTFPIRQRGARMPYYVDFQYVGEMNSYNKRVEVGDMAAAPTQVQIINSDWTTVAETVSSGNIYLVRDERDPVTGPIRALEFADVVTSLGFGMRVNITGSWGFPSVPGNVRQAVLDAIAWIRDRDVEHYRQDLSVPQGSETAAVVVVGNAGPRVVSLPPTALSVAWSYRDPVIG